MTQADALKEWRQADKAAVRAEDDARAAARARKPNAPELTQQARRLRRYADNLWRAFLGSGFAPPATGTAAPQSPSAHVTRGRPASVDSVIDEWRRAQARAHAAEVRTVQAYVRLSQGLDEEAASTRQAEASMLRADAAARLQRVYDMLAAVRRKA